MTDLESCARYLATLAAKTGKEPQAEAAIDEYHIKGGSKPELRRAFDRLDPPDSPVADAIRAYLDE